MSAITELTPYLLRTAFSLVVLLSFLIMLRKDKQNKNLKKKYKESLEANMFLLSVEDKHCRNNSENFNRSLRNTMRKQVSFEDNIVWNSRFSKVKCLCELEKMREINNSIFIFKNY